MSRFFREFRENPERNIENIERVNDDNNTPAKNIPNKSGKDDIDEKLLIMSQFSKGSKKSIFGEVKKEKSLKEEIKVVVDTKDTPLTMAYRKLDLARRSGDRISIINAEDEILDLQYKEVEQENNKKIHEFKQMQSELKKNGDVEGLKQFKSKRKAFMYQMKLDELNYQKQKLQNIQRVNPSKENYQKILDINKELSDLELVIQNGR